MIGVCPSRIGSICPFLLRKIKAAGKESERVDRGSILGYDLAKRTCMDSYFLRPILCARPLLVESNKNLHVFSPCHRKKKTFAFTWRLLPCPRESKRNNKNMSNSFVLLWIIYISLELTLCIVWRTNSSMESYIPHDLS